MELNNVSAGDFVSFDGQVYELERRGPTKGTWWGTLKDDRDARPVLMHHKLFDYVGPGLSFRGVPVKYQHPITGDMIIRDGSRWSIIDKSGTLLAGGFTYPEARKWVALDDSDSEGSAGNYDSPRGFS